MLENIGRPITKVSNLEADQLLRVIDRNLIFWKKNYKTTNSSSDLKYYVDRASHSKLCCREEAGELGIFVDSTSRRYDFKSVSKRK